MEFLDIYNDNHEYLGTCEKKLTHKLGLWHDVFTCLLVNPESKTVIMQIKNHSHNNIHDKDLIEISVGGHYQAGEKLEEGIREIKEETGVDAEFKELINLGIRQVAMTVNPNYIVREFQHIFLLPVKKSINEFIGFDKDEITGLIEFNIEDLIDLLLKQKKSIKGKTIENDEVIDKKISLDNFVKNYLEGDELYLRLAVAAKRYMNGEDTKYIRW